MKAGPNISTLAALVGDPARANMLTALMSGRALTASELATEAGVTPQTASTHLARLEAGGLVVALRQGRHRYFQLSGPDVASVLESLMGLAARTGHMRVRTGPKDPAMRRARVCYDHLAGDAGVDLLDRLASLGAISGLPDAPRLTASGRRLFADLGLDLATLEGQRRPLCRCCLDWSARRVHLGGALGAGLLQLFCERQWARRDAGSRTITFSPRGKRGLKDVLGIEVATG